MFMQVSLIQELIGCCGRTPVVPRVCQSRSHARSNEFKTSSTAERQRSTVGERPSNAGEQKYRAIRKRWPRLGNARQSAVETKVSTAGSRSKTAARILNQHAAQVRSFSTGIKVMANPWLRVAKVDPLEIGCSATSVLWSAGDPAFAVSARRDHFQQDLAATEEMLHRVLDMLEGYTPATGTTSPKMRSTGLDNRSGRVERQRRWDSQPVRDGVSRPPLSSLSSSSCRTHR
jgi:hypothetical protein